MNIENRKPLNRIAAAVLMISVISIPAFAQNYLTDFNKDNNIYTDLNQQFPNTGAGVPGSHTGVPNASFIFNPETFSPPGYRAGSDIVNNGVNFDITSDANGHDFAQIGTGGSGNPYDGPKTLTVGVGLDNVSKVYLLMGAYNGQSFDITFNGLGGSETFDSIGIPDFNGGVGNGSINGSGTGSGGTSYLDQTVFITDDVGAGGSGNSSNGAGNAYDLTEVTFNLDSNVQSQDLTSFTITSNGYEILLLGASSNGNVPGNAGVPDGSSTALLLIIAGAILIVTRASGKRVQQS